MRIYKSKVILNNSKILLNNSKLLLKELYFQENFYKMDNTHINYIILLKVSLWMVIIFFL